MLTANNFFTEEQKSEIVNAIKKAELNTSGEIRVHIENSCKGNVLDRAAFIFKKLEMHKTALRNGVLIYLAVNDKKFAVLGDAGINSVVPDNFWNESKDIMINYFKQSQFTQGLCESILIIGNQLKTKFPYQKDDINELPDEISFG
ncbi:MAG: TPM domain-containing protein [Bacteroidota bacterium]|nr:TPM domain-containing protein [Bacteroidota bacterium]